MLKTRLHRVTRPIVSWALQKYGAARYETSGEARLLPLAVRLRKKKLLRFYKNGALDARLTQIDSDRPIKRIYIMGCGRSGTWLLTAAMSTFQRRLCAVKGSSNRLLWSIDHDRRRTDIEEKQRRLSAHRTNSAANRNYLHRKASVRCANQQQSND